MTYLAADLVLLANAGIALQLFCVKREKTKTARPAIIKYLYLFISLILAGGY
jgi:hypothetical protein